MTKQVLAHSWRMISADWGMTFRITVVPWLAILAAFLILDRSADGMGDRAPIVALGIPLLILVVVVYLWVLVGWHRYVLLGEGPRGFGPRWNGGQNLSYLGWAILITLILMIPVGFVSMIGMAVLNALAGFSLGFFTIYSSAVLLVFSYLSLRLCLVLPSAAVDGKMTIGLSWQKTGAISSTIWGLSVALVVLQILMEFLGSLFVSTSIGGVISLAGSGLIGLLGVSVMTSLYGHLVEGRSLGS